MRTLTRSSIRLLPALAAVVLLLSCAVHNQTFTTGQQLLAEGKLEEGLATLQRAMEEEPHNQEYRAYYYRQRDSVISQWLNRAEEARLANDFDAAEALYRRVLGLDATNSRAQAGIDRVAMDRRHRAVLKEAEAALNARNVEEAAAKIRLILTENPTNREARIMQRINSLK